MDRRSFRVRPPRIINLYESNSIRANSYPTRSMSKRSAAEGCQSHVLSRERKRPVCCYLETLLVDAAMQSESTFDELSPVQQAGAQQCNQELCDYQNTVYPSIPWYGLGDIVASKEIRWFFSSLVPSRARCH